jgi:photosystem II stability/assembly factor-like uncharacterized protein
MDSRREKDRNGNMSTLHPKIFRSFLTCAPVVFLLACGGLSRQEQKLQQIQQSEGLTFEEKIQELISRGASRMEAIGTFGHPTGYTYDTLSYTVSGDTLLSFPITPWAHYPDPEGQRGSGSYRWVFTFDDRGILNKYRRIPIDHVETSYVYCYQRDEMGFGEPNAWSPAYATGFTALECIDRDHCWAAGALGLLLETSDGGKTWVSRDSGIDRYQRYPHIFPYITSLTFPNRRIGWLTGRDTGAAAFGGLILHSSDEGKSWLFQLKSDSKMFPQPGLSSIIFNDHRQGWAVGANGTILHTSDAGRKWTAQSSGTEAYLLSVGFCDRERGWAVGSSRTILHTVSAGQSWRSQTISVDQLPSKVPKEEPRARLVDYILLPDDLFTSLSFVDCLRGWVAGSHGAILHTEDGGVTWLTQSSGTTERLNAVQFITKDKGWAIGERGVILNTIDGGKTWQPQSSGTREDLHDISFVDTDFGWIGGSFGTILHTSNGGDTWIKQCLNYDCAGDAAQQFYWHPWLK